MLYETNNDTHTENQPNRYLFLLSLGVTILAIVHPVLFGSHSFKRNEIEELTKAGVDEIVIGTGTNSKARLSNEAINYAGQSRLRLHILPSYKAVPEFNNLVEVGKKVAAIIHITC